MYRRKAAANPKKHTKAGADRYNTLLSKLGSKPETSRRAIPNTKPNAAFNLI